VAVNQWHFGRLPKGPLYEPGGSLGWATLYPKMLPPSRLAVALGAEFAKAGAAMARPRQKRL